MLLDLMTCPNSTAFTESDRACNEKRPTQNIRIGKKAALHIKVQEGMEAHFKAICRPPLFSRPNLVGKRDFPLEPVVNF